MAKHDCEVFGHMLYSSELSYNELYAIEADLIDELQAALERINAEHIDLVGLGDALRMQCVLTDYDEIVFHELCDAVAAFLPKKVQGRLLFVHKDLSIVHLYCFMDGGWKEAAVDISMKACRIGEEIEPAIMRTDLNGELPDGG
ncbi:hypothetical protein N1030_14450 [Desulfovibrio mangrovi]|uniref:hypothetical protein n=1 Tax=Desulfovibrio mangrovi TaxID=2976983 RepID=UPI002245BAF9|nr:hypothetical protein [Desulfovibrio mangrovi]UZP66799.1 hypothetical protein N1030_14450 [Desulfovibrio mangrovi]